MAAGLQHCETAFLARIPNPGGVRRNRRNRLRRFAQQGLRVSAGCSTRALRCNRNAQASNRRWMKVQWQVTFSQRHLVDPMSPLVQGRLRLARG